MLKAQAIVLLHKAAPFAPYIFVIKQIATAVGRHMLPAKVQGTIYMVLKNKRVETYPAVAQASHQQGVSHLVAIIYSTQRIRYRRGHHLAAICLAIPSDHPSKQHAKHPYYPS